MQQLSGLDAAFLYLESSQSPMHVGGVYLFAGLAHADRFDFRAFRAHLAARLDTARTFRQRLLPVPLNLDYPYWIEDQDFDLDAHLSHQVLAKPGHWEDLLTLAEQLFSRPLDRQRPLWEMSFVEGLSGITAEKEGSFALIVKVHHAAVDGLAGMEMIWALLDPKPLPGKRRQSTPWQPGQPPSTLNLLSRTALRTIEQPFTFVKLAGQMATGAVQLAQEKILYRTPLPPLPLTAPRTRFNGPVTADRTLRAIVLPLKQVQTIRRRIVKATVNDVVLAICSGALRRYLEAHRELPEQSLVAAVPIAMRSRDCWQAMGNQVSAMLVSLATDESDPCKRFQRIHDSAQHARRDYQAIGLERLSDLIPSTLMPPISWFYYRLGLIRWLKPIFNLFITNIPGPQQPLYLGNARLLYHLGMAPICDGLGLILVVTSYLDTLVISATSCSSILPDPEVFSAHLQESFAELDAMATG